MITVEGSTVLVEKGGLHEHPCDITIARTQASFVITEQAMDLFVLIPSLFKSGVETLQIVQFNHCSLNLLCFLGQAAPDDAPLAVPT